MIIKKIDKKSVEQISSERRNRARDLLEQMYADGHNCFSIEKYEDEYKTLASLRSYLNEESLAISEGVLKGYGFSIQEIRVLKKEYGKLMNVFHIRKVPCKPVLIVEIKQYSESAIAEFRRYIAEKRK